MQIPSLEIQKIIIMSIQRRKYNMTHSFQWGDNQLKVEFRAESSLRPFSPDYRTGRASVDLIIRMRDSPPQSQWFEKLRAFANFESTRAWREIVEKLDSMDQLSPHARDFVHRVVRAEVSSAYEKTVLLKHFVMAAVVIVTVVRRARVESSDESSNEFGLSDEEETSDERTVKWRRLCRGRKRDVCGVCGEGLLVSEWELECKHAFHSDCYMKWKMLSDQCPACRPQVL